MKAAPLIAVLYFVPAINLGGLPPFSGFIGKFALFQAAAQVATPLIWVLIVGGVLTSLLTLYALMRAWNLAFWRSKDETPEEMENERIAHLGSAPAADEQQERRRIPTIMTFATGGMVAVTLALTVFAGPPIYGLCERIGANLLQPVHLDMLDGGDGGASS